MAHFDGGAELLIILLSILGLYLILTAGLLIQDMLGRRHDRKKFNTYSSGNSASHITGGP